MEQRWTRSKQSLARRLILRKSRKRSSRRSTKLLPSLTSTHQQVLPFLRARSQSLIDASLVAVLTDPRPISALVKKHSPDTLVVLDAVCAVASEEIRMDAWGIDVIITASQKGLGAPPGLSIVIASEKALKVSSCLQTYVLRQSD